MAQPIRRPGSSESAQNHREPFDRLEARQSYREIALLATLSAIATFLAIQSKASRDRLALKAPPGVDEEKEKPHASWKETIEYLASFGLERVSRHREIAGFAAVSILIAILAITFRASLPLWIGMRVHEIILTVSGFFIVFLGYQQWHENRHEISMDKYYERLDIANRVSKDGGGVVYDMMRHSRPELDDVDPRKMAFIYAELDNLEYVAEKYYLGFMKPEQACRGLRTFQRRCFSEEFRNLALDRVRSGDYNGRTATIVREVVKRARAELATTGQLSLPLPKGSIDRQFSLMTLWLMY